MRDMLFYGGPIYTPWEQMEDGWLRVRDGRIDDMGCGAPPSAESAVSLAGRKLVPGFIELHMHGRSGVSVMDVTREPEALARLSADLPATGVTTFVPTTLSDEWPRTLAVVGALAEAIRSGLCAGAQPAGIYSEGVFFNPVRCGAQNPARLRSPSPEDVAELLAAGRGLVRVLALSPELPGAAESVRLLSAEGVVASMAHTDAEFEHVTAAVEAGLTHVTHQFNAMRPMSHLALGASGAGLCLDCLTVEIIADGLHLMPQIVELVFRCKGTENIVLITDSVEFAGCPDGEYDFSGVPVRKTGPKLEVIRDGPFSLAGSCLTLDAALRNALDFTGRPMTQVLPCVTANPARILGLNRKGCLAPGMDADIAVLDEQNNVCAALAEGRVIYDAGFIGD